MDQDHFFRDAAEQQGIRRGAVAPAHHYNGLALIEHAVTGGAVGNTPVHQRLLPGKAQFSGACSGGDDHRFSVEGAFAGFHHLGGTLQIQLRDLGIFRFRAEPLRLGLHFFRQGEAVDALLEAGVIVDLMGHGHLSAGGQLFQHNDPHAGPGGIQGGGVTAGATPDDDHIVYRKVIHSHCSFRSVL